MGAEVEKLVCSQQATAFAATLYTVGLDGVRTLCLRWAGPFPDPRELIEQIEERALRQANALGGVHAFQLELSGATGDVLGTEFFRVSAESFADGRSIVSEPANEGGLVAQAMRHVEAVMKVNVQSTEYGLRSAHKLIEQATRRAEFSEEKMLGMLALVHTMISGERETQVALVRAEARGAATKQIAGKIAMLIPEISAAFLSGNAGPKGAAHAAALRAKSLFSSITKEQLSGILGHLQPEQQMGLFALMKGLAAENEAQQKEEASSAGGGTNGASH